MTQSQTRSGLGRHPTPPEYTPRLRLKPKAPLSGYVDGAWWPWSDDLGAEVADLLAVLSVRLGPIERVMYNLGEWAEAPTKVTIAGRVVRLDGYFTQPSNTVVIRGANRASIVLLVIPSHTEADQAHATMMAAAAPDNDFTVRDLLLAAAAK
jgi:Family of unknown function (DUF5994)